MASPHTKKAAERKSVVLSSFDVQQHLQEKREVKPEQRQVQLQESCFDGCFGLFGSLYQNPAAQYGPPRSLEPLPACIPWHQVNGHQEVRVQGVEIMSSAKEGVERWANQDATVVCLPGGGCQDGVLILGVFDGHGTHGHEVSQLAAERLPAHLAAFPGGPLADPRRALEEAFMNTDQDIFCAIGKKVEYSGTTGVVVILDLEKRVLHAGNVGDSRAVLGRYAANAPAEGATKAVALTEDLKPALPEERRRLEQSGACVWPMRGPDGEDIGVERVWDSPLRIKPGLAVSRSLGDGAGRRLGVIADPVITQHTLQEDDRFVIIGTDGLWDSIDNEEVVAMVSKQVQRGFHKVAVQALTEAVRQEEEGELGDDTTMVLLVL